MIKVEYFDKFARVTSDVGMDVRRKGHDEAYPAMTFYADGFDSSLFEEVAVEED